MCHPARRGRKVARLTPVVVLLIISVSKKQNGRVTDNTAAFVPSELNDSEEAATTHFKTSATEKLGKPFKFCLHLNQLNRRGVEVANYDYMTGLQHLLGYHEVVVACVTPQYVLDEQAAQVPDVVINLIRRVMAGFKATNPAGMVGNSGHR